MNKGANKGEIFAVFDLLPPNDCEEVVLGVETCGAGGVKGQGQGQGQGREVAYAMATGGLKKVGVESFTGGAGGGTAFGSWGWSLAMAVSVVMVMAT